MSTTISGIMPFETTLIHDLVFSKSTNFSFFECLYFVARKETETNTIRSIKK